MYVQEEVETSRLRRILRTRFSYPGFLPEFLIPGSGRLRGGIKGGGGTKERLYTTDALLT